MKRLVICLFCIALCFGSVFTALATESLEPPSYIPDLDVGLHLPPTYTMEEFYAEVPCPDEVMGENYRHDFISEDRVEALGDFMHIFRITSQGWYGYTLKDANGNRVELWVIGQKSSVKGLVEAQYATEIEIQSLTSLTKTGVPNSHVRIEEAYYLYDESGDLASIRFDYSQNEAEDCFVRCSLRSPDHFDVYRDNVADEDCLMSRLLDPKTAEKAVSELVARVNGSYVAPWVYPTAICGGAVVFATAVAVLATALSRKKRKAAVADTPAEEENA